MDSIRCMNWLCVYQREERCLLKKIEIDARGCCRNYIVANIPSKYLEKHKQGQLKYLPNYKEILWSQDANAKGENET